MGSLSIKERIERNVTVWFLGTLLTGFLAGVGMYSAIQDMAGLRVVPAAELDQAKHRISELEHELGRLQAHEAAMAARVSLAYQPVRSRRVRIVHNPPDLNSAHEIQGRLSELGAFSTLQEWKNDIPHSVRKLYHTEESWEAGLLIKRLISNLTSVSVQREDGLREESLDIVIWMLPKD